MRDRQREPSPALRLAQRRLAQLRQATAAERAQLAADRRPADHSPQPTLAACLARLPDHLGWRSAPATALVRRKSGPPADLPADLPADQAAVAQTGLTAGIPAGLDRAPTDKRWQRADPALAGSHVRLYPHIGLAMLQQGQAAPGRLWLLLRHMDGAGRGWLRIDRIQQALTTPGNPLHLCGRRQLRHLLRQGQGVFWERDVDRLWLRSTARVAQALNVNRLRGRPVALPVDVLLQGIGKVRAHLYASFHSGRRRPGPISRRRLAQISQVPERTQRVYDREAGVKRTANLAIGPAYDQALAQERAWRHGRAAFKFVDVHGTQGPAGRRYLAWRLPNSYIGPHRPCPRGRQKKINRQIDLVTKGAQGNGLPTALRAATPDRLFHPHGRSAARAVSRNNRHDIYWRTGSALRRQPALWQVIPGQGRR